MSRHPETLLRTESLFKSIQIDLNCLTLLGQHDLGRLDDGCDAVTLFEPHFLGALPGDDRFDHRLADAHRDVDEDVAPHDIVDLAGQVVAGAQSRHRASSSWAVHGFANRVSFNRALSVSALRKAMRSAFCSAVSGNPLTMGLLLGLSWPTPRLGPSATVRPPVA